MLKAVLNVLAWHWYIYSMHPFAEIMLIKLAVWYFNFNGFNFVFSRSSLCLKAFQLKQLIDCATWLPKGVWGDRFIDSVALLSWCSTAAAAMRVSVYFVNITSCQMIDIVTTVNTAMTDLFGTALIWHNLIGYSWRLLRYWAVFSQAFKINNREQIVQSIA